jgi:hypothetical protein
MNNTGCVWGLVVCVGLATGCSSDSNVDIGDGQAEQGLSAYAHSWDGYAEAYQFFDGSDRVRLTLDAEGKGTIRVGDAALLPEPKPGDAAPSDSPSPATDFVFAVTARLEGSRLRFDLNEWQRYDTWCRLQTPVAYSPEHPGVYSCIPFPISLASRPGGGCVAQDGSEYPLPCPSYSACGSYCECSATSCEASDNPVSVQLFGPSAAVPSSSFDGVLSADHAELTGTLFQQGGSGGGVTVHLRR